MLLLVLARLGCVRGAVQTSLLSRRWRGLWTSLTDLSFRRLEPTTIEAVLSRFSRSSVVSIHDVVLPYGQTSGAQANSLLCCAARLSPGKLVFTLLEDYYYPGKIELPCFPSTASIDLDTKNTPVELPAAGGFAALERLFLSGRILGLESLLNLCRGLRVLSVTYSDGEFPVLEKLSLSGNIVDLTTSLNRCPRLRVLRVTFKGFLLRCLEAALARLKEAGPFDFQLSLLGFTDIHQGHDNNNPCFATHLGIAARLSPQEFLFDGCGSQLTTQPLPSFNHTTSIQINLGWHICLKPLLDRDFLDLERLSLSGNIVNLDKEYCQ